MAVVVERMVDARAAGVAFSADPVTGRRAVVIEAARGLGEDLVSGRVIPDRFVVNARGTLEERAARDPAHPVLEDAEVLRLAEEVRRIVRPMDAPQDLEWAFDAKRFFFLQCRPITAIAGKRVLSHRLVADMCPGLVKPLLWSTHTLGMMRNVFRRVFTQLLGPNDIDFESLVRRVHSRIYADMTAFGEILVRLGLPRNFFEVMTRDERSERVRPRPSYRLLRSTLRFVPFAIRNLRAARDIEAFLKRHDADLEPYRRAPDPDLRDDDLIERIDRLMDLHGQTQWYVFIGPMNMMLRNRLLHRWGRKVIPDLVPGSLVRGLEGLKALEPNAELERLSVIAAQLGPEAVKRFHSREERRIREFLERSENGRVLLREVGRFLSRFGFLSANGTDFSEIPWVESPTLVWTALARLVRGGSKMDVESVRNARERAVRDVRSRMRPLRRFAFDRLLRSTIRFIELRERISMMMAEDAYRMRGLFRSLAERFARRGDLEAWDDIFYLFYPEVRELARGSLDPETARKRVHVRRKEIEADSRVELDETVIEDQVRARPIEVPEHLDVLTGINVSAGVVQGYARVVHDPADLSVDLRKEDILIVPFTDVGWTPLFPSIGGIVAETGGQLSHTSIIAREYGIPAVVSVRKATHLIREGQPITVDGTHGTVYLKHVKETREVNP
jgi:pyruvate,water dikinase